MIAPRLGPMPGPAAADRDHARRVLGLPALVSCIAPANTASRRLARRLGATCEGTLADPEPPDGAEVSRHRPEGPA